MRSRTFPGRVLLLCAVSFACGGDSTSPGGNGGNNNGGNNNGGNNGSSTSLVATSNISIGGGTVTYDSVVIPASITVTLNADAKISVKGAARVAGTLVADCKALELNATGALTITGQVKTSCATARRNAPTLTLASAAGITILNATVESSGHITIADVANLNTTARTAATARAFTLEISNSTVKVSPTRAEDGTDGADGADGEGIDVRSLFAAPVLRNATIVAQDGGNGGNVVGSLARFGGRGGDGGKVGFLTTEVEIRKGDGPVRLQAGNGGKGGDATIVGTGDLSFPDVLANRSFGGLSGTLGFSAFVTLRGDGDLIIGTGNGGDGGNLTVTVPNGAAATATSAATRGASVSNAFAGPGGDIEKVIFDFKSQLTSPVQLAGGRAGRGGNLRVTVGNGGNGSFEFPAGAQGGSVHGAAGSGGVSEARDPAGAIVGLGGHGGSATILPGGNGGRGAATCGSSPARVGGAGGLGGNAESGMGGSGGSGKEHGVAGAFTISNFGNGGNGGDGIPAGKGGLPSRAPNDASVSGESFTTGFDGAACPPPPPALTEIPGTYIVDAVMTDKTCANGGSYHDEYQTVSVSAGNITFAGFPAATGSYDAVTGSTTLTGTMGLPPNQTLEHIFIGKFGRNASNQIQFTGTERYNIKEGNTEVCHNLLNITMRRK